MVKKDDTGERILQVAKSNLKETDKELCLEIIHKVHEYSSYDKLTSELEKEKGKVGYCPKYVPTNEPVENVIIRNAELRKTQKQTDQVDEWLNDEAEQVKTLWQICLKYPKNYPQKK
ncbi:MAG: hypothetical protein LBC43_03165 [Bifidobacteriaceae bacterium]|jgi:hypothetical protein|nr:hypothetical protein [Bifidobacteriaceae bacterium]